MRRPLRSCWPASSLYSARVAASTERPRPGSLMAIGPAPVLALIVGLFHTALYVLVRGHAGGQLPLLFIAAVLGAWAGDALAARLGFDLLRVGDFRLLGASILAWVGLGFVSVIAILGPARGRT